MLAGRMTLQYVAGRGDWKFKASWLSETRDYNNLKMVSADPGFCRRCLSGSDVSSGHWLDAHGLSFYRPDDVLRILDDNMAPSLPLRRLPGWSPDMEAADTLHNCWMGPVKDCVASILMDIAQFDPRYTAYSVWDDALMAILHNFHAFCENHGLDKSVLDEISLVKLGVQALQFDFPSGFSKAYTNRILMLFVAHHLKATAVPELQLQAVAAWAVSLFGQCLDRGGVFFTEAERQCAAQSGLIFSQAHVALARRALLSGRPRYKVRPRFHSFLCEVVCKLLHGSTMNPKFTACWGDESYIGAVCQIGKCRAVHTSTIGLRLLQRLMLNLNSYLAELPKG